MRITYEEFLELSIKDVRKALEIKLGDKKYVDELYRRLHKLPKSSMFTTKVYTHLGRHFNSGDTKQETASKYVWVILFSNDPEVRVFLNWFINHLER